MVQKGFIVEATTKDVSITIEADKETGYVRLFKGKKLIDGKVNPSIEELMKMQEKAVQIAGEDRS